jgi:transcription antitermination factor NusG
MVKKEWYAVYTRPKSEKKVAAQLTRSGIDTYCPIQKSRRKWHDRYKVIDEPVFRSYVFVNIWEKEKTAVLSDSNVLHFVQHCGKPAAIRETEMLTLREFLREYEGHSFCLSDVVENDAVQIQDGVFEGYTGIVLKKSKRKASIRLELLNTYRVAEILDARYVKI